MSNMHNTDDALLVTIEEAARKLGLGRSTIYELMTAGELPTVRVGRSVRIAVKDLEDWIEGKKQRV